MKVTIHIQATVTNKFNFAIATPNNPFSASAPFE